jgi:hypothetical protein
MRSNGTVGVRAAHARTSHVHDKIARINSTLSLSSYMSDKKGQQPFKPSGLIEFEFTNVEDARREADKPAAVVAIEKLLPGYWEEQRRPLSAADKALTGKGIDWMLALPVNARPKVLCEQFPRIANFLAEQWSDPQGTQLALMRLLADERGKRKGFSLQIEQEIGRLAAYVQSLLEVAPTEPAPL